MFNKKINIFMGMLGSGKTEISLNAAIKLKSKYENVAIADIDVISSYFRSRDMIETFESKGIKIIAPEGKLMHADLPIIVPQVAGYITRKDYRVIIDVGGNDDGAVVLSSLKNHIDSQESTTHFVVNPYRPFTDTVAKTVDHIERLSQKSRRKIDYLINNANLGDETKKEHIEYGESFIKEVSEATNIPVFTTVIMNGIKAKNTEFTIFNVTKYIKKIWEV
ncbi:MAG: cobalamin biosynthesis protein CobQ [Thermotogota bacterium]|nr:cobalamin biosynthesis protein CobQ [Thermotogota bacterium]